MALYYATIRRESISLLKFPFLSYVQVFLCEMSSVCLLKYLYSYFFFHFLFPCHFCFVGLDVASAVSSHFNNSFLYSLRVLVLMPFFALLCSFYIVFLISIICLFPLFIISMVNYSMQNSIPISWLYILTVYVRVSNSFSFFTNSLMLSSYIRWLLLL